MAAPNGMNFGKVSRGGEGVGVIFNQKNYVADLGNFKQVFLSMKLIQKSNFRVQGMFFNTNLDRNSPSESPPCINISTKLKIQNIDLTSPQNLNKTSEAKY